MKVWLWPYTAHSMMSVCNNAPLVNPQQKQPLKQCWLLEPSCTHVSRHCDRRQHCFTEEKVVHNSAFGKKEQVFSSKSLKPWLNYWSTTWDSNRGPQWLLYVSQLLLWDLSLQRPASAQCGTEPTASYCRRIEDDFTCCSRPKDTVVKLDNLTKNVPTLCILPSTI